MSKQETPTDLEQPVVGVVDLDHLEKLHAEWHDDTGQRHLRDLANYHTERTYGVALEFHNQSKRAVDRAANYIAATHNALPALIAELKGWRSQDEEWRNSRLPEDDAIAAAHPTKTGDDTLFAEAHRMVTARRSKPGLVALVNWLLSRVVKAEHNAEVELTERKRIDEASARAIITANDASIRHLEARMRDEAELKALRELASVVAARASDEPDDWETAITAALAKAPR